MQIDVVNMEGQKVGQMELADEVFGCKVREHLPALYIMNETPNAKVG